MDAYSWGRAPTELKVPNLVAIPNMLVNLLQNPGSAVTPYDVLASIDDFVQQSGDPGHHWEYVRKWCLVAGQANANGKSKVFLDTTPVTSTTRILTDGSEPASTLPSDPAPRRLRLQRRE